MGDREKLVELIGKAKCDYLNGSGLPFLEENIADCLVQNGVGFVDESRKAEVECLRREIDELRKKCVVLKEDLECYKHSAHYNENQVQYLSGKAEAYEFCIKNGGYKR